MSDSASASRDLIEKTVAEARAGTDPQTVIALALAAHAAATLAVGDALREAANIIADEM